MKPTVHPTETSFTSDRKQTACRGQTMKRVIALLTFLLLCPSVVLGQTCEQSSETADVALIDAVVNERFGAYQSAIEAGANVNARDHLCNTPLIWAVRSQNHAILTELLDLKVNVYAANALGRTALGYAEDRNLDGFVRAIKSEMDEIEEDLEQLVEAGNIEGFFDEIEKRNLSPNQKVGFTTVHQYFSEIQHADEDKVLSFILRMHEMGADVDWDDIAERAAKSNNITVYRYALQFVPPSVRHLSYKSENDEFLTLLIREVIQSPKFSGSYAKVYDGVSEFQSEDKALSMLKEIRAVAPSIGPAPNLLYYATGSVRRFSGGSRLRPDILKFILSHGIHVPDDAPVIARILGKRDRNWEFETVPFRLDLLDLALDLGSSPDIYLENYRPKLVNDYLRLVLLNAAEIDAENYPEVIRVGEKLIEAGGGFEDDLFGMIGREDSIKQEMYELFFENDVDPDLQLALLKMITPLEPWLPSICTMMEMARVDLVVHAASIPTRHDGDFFGRIDSKFGDNQWECLASISDPIARRSALTAAKKHPSQNDRKSVIETELNRLDAGAGDFETLAALVTDTDLECSGDEWDDRLVNRIATYLNKPTC